jgi:hypothetical protein
MTQHQTIEQEILPPLPKQGTRDAISDIAGFFHPVTALLALGLDWLLFGGTAATGGLGLFFFSLLGFMGGFAAGTLSQRLMAGDSWSTSLLKGLMTGVVVGAPLPVAGTAAGGLILTFFGLDALRESAGTPATRD